MKDYSNFEDGFGKNKLIYRFESLQQRNRTHHIKRVQVYFRLLMNRGINKIREVIFMFLSLLD